MLWNENEKAIVGTIYARASRVVVWLGDTNQAMMRAMK